MRAALAEDSQVAAFPFWDHDVEPPLCAAVRLGCSIEIVSALLEGGAEVDQASMQGKTPLQVLNVMMRPGRISVQFTTARSTSAMA